MVWIAIRTGFSDLARFPDSGSDDCQKVLGNALPRLLEVHFAHEVQVLQGPDLIKGHAFGGTPYPVQASQILVVQVFDVGPGDDGTTVDIVSKTAVSGTVGHHGDSTPIRPPKPSLYSSRNCFPSQNDHRE